MCVSFCLFVMSERACACLVRKSALHKLMVHVDLLVQHEKTHKTGITTHTALSEIYAPGVNTHTHTHTHTQTHTVVVGASKDTHTHNR